MSDIIYSYTRADAISDGVLIDISSAPVWTSCGNLIDLTKLVREHYKYPLAVTAGVWALIEKAVFNKEVYNDFEGVVHDILWMSRKGGQAVGDCAREFDVIIKGAGRRKIHSMRIECHPGDNHEPVLTVLLKGED